MSKNKIIIGLAIYFCFSGLAQAEQINPACFKNTSSIDVNSTNTLKVGIPNTSKDVFFVAGADFVPYKIFEDSKGVNIPYVVLKTSSGDANNYKFIGDNNPTTFYSFDDLNDKEKSIILDFGKAIEKGDFNSKIDYIHYGIVRFQISMDNSEYSNVSEYALGDFSFRYLKITFSNFLNDSTVKKTQINDITFSKSSPIIYLLKPISKGKIDIYTNYDCSGEQMKEIYAKYMLKNMKTNFPIDSTTATFDVSMIANTSYDNDFDKDRIDNQKDNCKYTSNVEQKDIDGDLVGDVCDFDNSNQNPLDGDYDKDGVGDSVDNCKYDFNPNQRDTNSDLQGDVCMDDDNDRRIGRLDNCPNVSNPDQKDVNVNNVGDACEFDKDTDGIFDSIDNCITAINPEQTDADNDGIGDKCDNCEFYNPDQKDKEGNGIGDVCDERIAFEKTHDKDKDKKVDSEDNCKDISNPNQEDLDKDGIGDVCDNCVSIQNPDQKDVDKSGVGDMCEDTDKDGVDGFKDNCITVSNTDQKDSDNNGVGDKCEDSDNDGIIFVKDNCPYDYNEDQSDVDKDGKGDVCDKKDNRFMESNRPLFIGLLILISGIFGVGIVTMVKKINK